MVSLRRFLLPLLVLLPTFLGAPDATDPVPRDVADPEVVEMANVS